MLSIFSLFQALELYFWKAKKTDEETDGDIDENAERELEKTAHGIVITKADFTELAHAMTFLDNISNDIRCAPYCFEEHLNQMGYLSCVECNPHTASSFKF